MTGAGPAPAQPIWPMFRALVGVGLVSGLLIVGVYELTRPIIERNRAEALHQAIFDAVPEGDTSVPFEWTGERFAPVAGTAAATQRVFAAYDDGGELLGVAIEAEGMGYQDVIKILYAYAPAERAIVGMVVLESRETPGLGDKIATDAEFLENFERLDVSRRIEAVKHGEKTEPWQIDSITGATISSVAIADILADSTGDWVARIEDRLADFSKN